MALTYVTDTAPGITRRRCGRGFSYFTPEGRLISDPIERARIADLGVPPAYTDVWICPEADGHLQATGRDARGRKQYLYHPDWTAAQAETKFDKLVDFGNALPRIRRQVRTDLSEDAGERQFALAATVRLIDKSAMRVGNEAYAKENGSYGALTLRGRHIALKENRILLDFSAKGGRRVRRQIADKTLARSLEKMGDLPGGTLLGWVDDAGDAQTLNADALNAYLKQIAGDNEITAKTFRTWAGTVAAFDTACVGPATIKEMATAAAKVLHNSPTIARNSYIHPDVIDLAGQPAPTIAVKARTDLRIIEEKLLGFLER